MSSNPDSRRGKVNGRYFDGTRYVVVVPPLELVVVMTFCGGTSAGPVNAVGVWSSASPMNALTADRRFDGLSGKSAIPSYAATTTVV